jgi:hypothetical protein
MVTIKQHIATIKNLNFPIILKNFERYLKIINWLYSFILFYLKLAELLQKRKINLLAID